MENTNDWISNIGNTQAQYPVSISYDTEIEIKFREGETDTGYAAKWTSSWIDVGEDWDIVAYRVI